MKKQDSDSKSPQQDKLNWLKENMPEIFTEDKIDCDKLKQTLGENVDGSERYGLSWAGKQNCFKEIQRKTTATLRPDRSESLNFDDTENIFIEGENLEVLKVLQKSYHKKVKMIYIDPPYNTGNDFVYRDNYSETEQEYLDKAGELDEEGNLLRDFRKNSKDGGRYHSNWLNMMYPRLYLARNLLRDDGVIFVSIDDNEVHNLRMVMNEIFGEENFVAQIAWRRSDNQANIGDIARVKEYILLYSRSKDEFSLNKMDLSEKAKKEYRYSDDKGKFRRKILLDKTRGRHNYEVETPNGNILDGPWMVNQDEFEKLEKNNGIYWTSGEKETPYGKIYLEESDGQISNDFLGIKYGTNQQAARKLEKLFDKRIFDFPKPVSLIKHFVTIGTDKNDIIMDYFAGSAATAQAVMEKNKEDNGDRKFFMVQLPEQTNEDSKAYDEGYDTISEVAKDRIKKAAEKIKEEQEEKLNLDDNGELDLGFKSFELSPTSFKVWRSDLKNEEQLQKQMEEFIDNLKPEAKKEFMLYELMLKNGIDLNADIEDKEDYYVVNGGEYVFCLEDEINEEIISNIVDENPRVVVCLDVAFQDDDELKTNTSLQFEEEGVEFKVV